MDDTKMIVRTLQKHRKGDNMQNEIYRRVVNGTKTAHQDGAAAVVVTEESNGYFIWVYEPLCVGTILKGFSLDRAAAIEFGVDMARRPLRELMADDAVSGMGIQQ